MGKTAMGKARKRRALVLVLEMKEKMEEYFLGPPEEEKGRELGTIRSLLEKIGILVSWQVIFDPATFTYIAEPTLFLVGSGKPISLRELVSP